MNNLGQLPIEIISSIVNHITKPGYLYNYTLINKSFYTATSPLLWKKLDIDSRAAFIKYMNGLLPSQQQQQQPLLQQHHLGQHVRHLVLHPCTTNAMLLMLMKVVPHLDTLDIYSKSITDEIFQHLPQHCPDLTTLTLRHVPITARSFIALGQHCHHLHKLILNDYRHLSPNILPALALCPLNELTISFDQYKPLNRPDWLMQTNDNDNNNNSNNNTVVVVEDLCRFLQLTTLKLSSRARFSDLGARILQTPAIGPHLTTLSLNRCGSTGLTSSQLTAFLESHCAVVHLQLYELKPHLIPVALSSAATFLPRLQSMVLGNRNVHRKKKIIIPPQLVRHLVHQCPSLTYLDLLNGKFSKTAFPTEWHDGDDDDDDDDEDGFVDGVLEKYSIDQIRCEPPDPDHGNPFDDLDQQQQQEEDDTDNSDDLIDEDDNDNSDETDDSD